MTELAATSAPDLPTSKYGVAGVLDNGSPYVKFVRHLPFPIEKVWSALTEPGQLADWFPGLDLDAREGGAFEIRFSDDCEGEAHVSGTVTTFSPPNLLEMGTLRWELQPDQGGCLLTFTDILSFDDRDPTDLTNPVLAGWHKYVDSLERALHGGRGDPRTDPEIDYAEVNVPGRI